MFVVYFIGYQFIFIYSAINVNPQPNHQNSRTVIQTKSMV